MRRTSLRRIIANLFCEDDLARLVHAGDPRRRRHRPPSGEVLRTASRMATLLRVFAHEGDRLWLPAPVEPGEIEPIPGLPLPIFESGPLERLEPASEILAWCETPEVAALRSPSPPTPLPSHSHPPGRGAPPPDPLHFPPLPVGREGMGEGGQGGEGLWELVWHLPVAPPSVVAAVHHRAFHLQVAVELGCALPGARMVESLAELDRVLAGRNAPPAWVVKAPLSASGRSRYIERNGPLLSDPKVRRTVERLFEHHGPLFFEPWMDRIADYGCAALLTPSELRLVSVHRQRVDARGQFAGIELGGVPEQVRERLEEVVQGVAEALRQEGYAGPFGIDAWQYRQPDGSIAFHPLGEINARMTFGLVARAWAERSSFHSDDRDTF